MWKNVPFPGEKVTLLDGNWVILFCSHSLFKSCLEGTDCALVTETPTTVLLDSDTPAFLPGYKITDGHDAVLVSVLLGWLGSMEPGGLREVVGERRDLSACLHRRWKLDNPPSCALQVWDFLAGGSFLQELSWVYRTAAVLCQHKASRLYWWDLRSEAERKSEKNSVHLEHPFLPSPARERSCSDNTHVLAEWKQR